MVLSFDPRPVQRDWNGAGAHTNYITKSMKSDGGYEVIKKANEKLEKKHKVDRVYLSSPNCVAVLDHQRKRTFVIRKEGLPYVVVWNPWEKKSKAMADMGDDEYKQMVCVDGAVIERLVTLKPGEEWTGRLEILLVPSSFCSGGLCF